MPYSLDALNQMSQEDFITGLGDIFEQTPTIAAAVWKNRPFISLADLHQKMVAIVYRMTPAEQLALIRAHPDLGSRAKMADASVQEQAGVGLDRLSPEEYQRFHQLNQTYRETFGFPFIIAVRNHTKASILKAFETRLRNDPSAEQQQALTEVTQIAWFRLQDLVHSKP